MATKLNEFKSKLEELVKKVEKYGKTDELENKMDEMEASINILKEEGIHEDVIKELKNILDTVK